MAFPETEKDEAQFSDKSLDNILFKEDLEPDNLIAKFQASRSKHFSHHNNELFLTACVRLIENRNVSNKCIHDFMIRYEGNLEKQLILLDEDQRMMLQKVENNANLKNFAFAGPYGSGKTIMALSVVKRLLDRYKNMGVEKVFVFLLSCTETTSSISTYRDKEEDDDKQLERVRGEMRFFESPSDPQMSGPRLQKWPPLQEKGQSLSILPAFRSFLKIPEDDEFCKIGTLQECFNAFCNDEQVGLYRNVSVRCAMMGRLDFGNQLYRKVNKLMKELKAAHRGNPVILLLDEISAFGNVRGNEWDFLKPPGSSADDGGTGPGDTLNLILAFNPVTKARGHEDMKFSEETRSPGDHSPFLYQDPELEKFLTDRVYLPENETSKKRGFLTKKFHLRYRNSEKIQVLTKYLGHEMKIYLKDSTEEVSVACVAGDFPLWIDLGCPDTVDTDAIGEALKIMLEKTVKATRNEKILLFDGFLPKEIVEFLFSFGETNQLKVQDEKYYNGCETDAVIYFGSGHLEAFSRPKLQLCIITCFFNQEVSEKLLETLSFADERLANLKIINTSWKMEDGTKCFGELNIRNIPRDTLNKMKLEMFDSLQNDRKVWYNCYTKHLSKAEEKGMVIKIQPDLNMLEGMLPNLFNERHI